jgi:adenine phosphoribosyltransferase
LAAVKLLRSVGAVVDRAAFVIDLPDLGGADRLRDSGVAVHHLVAFEGD